MAEFGENKPLTMQSKTRHQEEPPATCCWPAETDSITIKPAALNMGWHAHHDRGTATPTGLQAHTQDSSTASHLQPAPQLLGRLNGVHPGVDAHASARRQALRQPVNKLHRMKERQGVSCTSGAQLCCEHCLAPTPHGRTCVVQQAKMGATHPAYRATMLLQPLTPASAILHWNTADRKTNLLGPQSCRTCGTPGVLSRMRVQSGPSCCSAYSRVSSAAKYN